MNVSIDGAKGMERHGNVNLGCEREKRITTRLNNKKKNVRKETINSFQLFHPGWRMRGVMAHKKVRRAMSRHQLFRRWHWVMDMYSLFRSTIQLIVRASQLNVTLKVAPFTLNMAAKIYAYTDNVSYYITDNTVNKPEIVRHVWFCLQDYRKISNYYNYRWCNTRLNLAHKLHLFGLVYLIIT